MCNSLLREPSHSSSGNGVTLRIRNSAQRFQAARDQPSNFQWRGKPGILNQICLLQALLAVTTKRDTFYIKTQCVHIPNLSRRWSQEIPLFYHWLRKKKHYLFVVKKNVHLRVDKIWSKILSINTNLYYEQSILIFGTLHYSIASILLNVMAPPNTGHDLLNWLHNLLVGCNPYSEKHWVNR